MDSSAISNTQEVVRHPDHLESSSSSINIPLSSRHLPPGDLRLTCAASIADVVTSVSEELLVSRPSPEHVLELRNGAHSFLIQTAMVVVVVVMAIG